MRKNTNCVAKTVKLSDKRPILLAWIFLSDHNSQNSLPANEVFSLSSFDSYEIFITSLKDSGFWKKSGFWKLEFGMFTSEFRTVLC